MSSSRSRETNPKCLVFVGPTLSGLSQWKADHSTSLVLHPPVRCGDMLEAYDEGYRKVVIIDGYFERYAAVWHKEIMHFMVRGGTCVGCSSMGALRAVELAPFGMLGFGKVVDDFRTGVIADDDEVTVAHLDQSRDFASLTDAMVNIRYTVADAVTRGAVESADAQQILGLAKSSFYKKRSLQLFARQVLGDGPKLAAFQTYLDEHGIIDQKRLDAVNLLENLDDFLAEVGTPKWQAAESFNNTAQLRTLQYVVNINPPRLEPQALSFESRILKLGRLLVGHQHHLLVKLAGALMRYAKHSEERPTPSYVPVSWLDQSWFGDDERIPRLLALALEDCPEYLNPKTIPLSVRHVALSIEYPLDYINLELNPSHGDSLSSNSTTNYSRLLYLVGLFLDARLEIDPVAQRLTPAEHAVDIREAQYTLRGYETPEQQQRFLQTFGLDNLREAARAIERNGMLLTETELGFRSLFDEDVHWYELAVRVGGIWPQLCSLTKRSARDTFSRELADDLARRPPVARHQDLLLASLPTTLLTADSILKYIQQQLDLS